MVEACQFEAACQSFFHNANSPRITEPTEYARRKKCGMLLLMPHSPGFLAAVNEARPRVRELTVAQTQERLTAAPEARLIDVREDTEWANGHAAGATHIGKGVIERDIETQFPNKSTELILYCGGGFRSIIAADALQRMGYTNVASMDGGWREWRDAGAPVEGTNS
jgi:rhodanese-related sulfurtransferase